MKGLYYKENRDYFYEIPQSELTACSAVFKKNDKGEKQIVYGVGEMAYSLRNDISLTKDPIWVPRMGSSQTPVTPTPRDLTPPSGIHRHLHFMYI